MMLKEFYTFIGGDYNQVFSQLGDDDVISEFLNKFFIKDDITELENLLKNKKYKDAFIIVHNIKGYGLNMALTPLHEAAGELCEVLRNGNVTADIVPLFDSLKSVYNNIKKVFFTI